jgi:UDP-glucose 4-epimerase
LKILITGSNGFIGGNLKDFFLKKNYNTLTPKRDELNLLDKNLVKNYLINNKFDIVIHSAVTLESVDQNLDMYFNIEGSSKYFGKLICIGSGAEYDKRKYIPRMNESYFGKSIPQKEDIYGYSKYIIAKDIIEKNKNIFNLRLFGIFGKYEDYRRRLISNNICKKICGDKVTINKNSFFDYMYVEDFCNILEKFIKEKPLENTYNLCTGQTIDFVTIANIINNIDYNGNKVRVLNEGLNPEYSGDNSKFVDEFGDFNYTKIADSINKLYNWYKNNSGLIFDDKIFNDWKKSNLGK